MAPASGSVQKKTGGSKKKKKSVVGIDFKRVKSKVGRKLPPARNSTSVDFKSKAIVLSSQTVVSEKEGLAVSNRRQTLKELLGQTTHYSERVRREALMGLKDLFLHFPEELPMHAMAIIEKLSPRITDSDRSVRQTFLLLLRSSILPGLPQVMMGPLVPGLMAHVSSAMTHLVLDIRTSACSFLDLLVHHYPALVLPFSSQIVQHYTDLLGKGGVSALSMAQLGSVLSSLVNFLAALHSSLATQPVETKKDDTGDKLQALHGYRSVTRPGGAHHHSLYRNQLEAVLKPEPSLDPCSTNGTGSRVGRIKVVAAPLVPVLLECWAECSPTVCGVLVPDTGKLSCMTTITRAVSLLFQAFILDSSSSSSSQHFGGRHMGGIVHGGSTVSDVKQEEQELRFWMRQLFLPGLQRHFMAFFPITASSIRLPVEVEEELIALNVGICEVMLQLIVPPPSLGNEKNIKNEQHHVTLATLEYFESALYGMMLPSSELSAGSSVNKSLAERHTKLLVSFIPNLLPRVSQDWVAKLLQAFTQVFVSTKAHSPTKLACLAAMADMLLPQRSGGGKSEVPLGFQKQWMQCLPHLLWELKHTHPTVSQAVLQMLLQIGRSAPNGSVLAGEFSALQQQLIPFFCTFFTSTKNGVKCIYGPFSKLPRNCQELAIDMFFFFTNFSRVFLKAVAHCCLSAEISVEVTIRAVEVLHSVFIRGSLGLPEHLSFLLTLLSGHISAQAGASHAVVIGGSTELLSPTKEVTSKDINLLESLGEESRRRQMVVAGVVCACLVQVGNKKLVLQLLGPTIHQELGRCTTVEVAHSFLRVISVLSLTDRKNNSSSFLPDNLREMLPQCVCNFLISVALVDSVQSKTTLCRPCLVLISKSPSFGKAVLNCLNSLLHPGPQLATSAAVKRMCASVQTILDICKQETLVSTLSTCEETLRAILHTLKKSVELEVESEEGSKLQTLCNQLESTAAALYGWQVENMPP